MAVKRILAISGGGMRGAGSARFLIELEARLRARAGAVFDLFSGTSTGAILAALCVSPRCLSAYSMQDFYLKCGPRIFPHRPWNFGIFRPRYRQADLERELRLCVGDATAGELSKKLLVAAVEANCRDAYFFKSWNPWWTGFPVWSMAAASASAQTYFPAFARSYRGKNYRFIDGGNFANNPAANALAEARALWPDEDIVIVSLGTGRQAQPRPLPDGGLLRWAPLVFDTMSECQNDSAIYFCANAPRVKFFHFDFEVEQFPGMDDACPATLNAYVRAAEASIAAEQNKWSRCLKALEA